MTEPYTGADDQWSAHEEEDAEMAQEQEVVSVFAAEAAEAFTIYECGITFRDLVLGGIPKDPKIIEGWIGTKMGITDEEEIRRLTIRTLEELGKNPDEVRMEDYEEIKEKIAAQRHLNGFKRTTEGLYLESRLVKACLRESTNICFAGEKWGPTRKGPKSYFVERVFVEPSMIMLGRPEPDEVITFIGHVRDRTGQKSTLTYFEACRKASISFRVMCLDDKITPEQWARIWVSAEKNGLGAVRSQGFGTFTVTKWDKISGPKRKKRGASVDEILQEIGSNDLAATV